MKYGMERKKRAATEVTALFFLAPQVGLEPTTP